MKESINRIGYLPRWLIIPGILLLNIVFKQAYAEVITSCPAGMKYEASLCYQPCRDSYIEDGPLCRQACRGGFSWNGLQCSKNFFFGYYPDSYTRSFSTPTVCDSSSFNRPLPSKDSPEEFTMVIASDTQYPWWHGSSCTTSDCVKQKGEQSNKEQIRSMNSVTNTQAGGTKGQWPDHDNVATALRGKAITEPKGVIINGDLTAFWHAWQAEKYMDMYHRNSSDPNNRDNLKLPLLPGLGNHDYSNNARDCWWSRNLEYTAYGANGCAKNATHYIKKMVSCNQVSNFPSSLITSFHEPSLAYSWTIGQYHFIQLHNYPTYAYPAINLAPSITWLRGELDRAGKAGRRIIINMHDYGEHMSQNNSEFLEAIAGKNVVALFAGHIHSSHGYEGTVPGRSDIPFFRSGASEYNTFLLVHFGKESMTVGVIDSKNGSPSFKNHIDSDMMKTIHFPTK